MKEITLPLSPDAIKTLRAGDTCLITGEIYTARDAAHKRMVSEHEKTGRFPFDIKNKTIYYCGPAPEKPGNVIGSCGPTTSGRMDKFAPYLMLHGLKGMIGKGLRTPEVAEAIIKNACVYFGATGGAGALLAKCVKTSEIIAYADLGAEAIRKLTVEKMPVIVIMDAFGGDLYKTEKEKYRKI